MLELRRAAAVRGDGGPVVRPRLVLVLAQADHGLDGEGHAGLALADGLVLAVVRHVGRAVEQRVDAVAAVRLDHAELPGSGVLLDDVAKVGDLDPRLDVLDGPLQALPRRLHEPHVVRVRPGLVSDVVRLVQVPVVPFVVERDVDVQNVPVLQDPLVGYAVADDFVGRGADRLWEMVVVQRRRI